MNRDEAAGPVFPPEVLTPRLLLRRPVPADRDALVALIGDPRIPEEQFPRRFRGAEATDAALTGALDHWARSGFGPWLARRRADGTLVGRVGLMGAEFEGRGCVEVMWFLGPDHWGAGYATEAAAAAIDAGFSKLVLPELLAWTMTTNIPSQAVMGRLGFEPIGALERGGLPHVAYRLTAADWRRRRPAVRGRRGAGRAARRSQP